jgi:SAM-dependent methyltransferase
MTLARHQEAAMSRPPALAATNAAQYHAWNGPEGATWAAQAARIDAGIAAYQTPLLDAAAVTAQDRVLDVGCGSGRVSLDAARRAPDGSVLGLDLSASMLAVARRAAADEGVENVEFVHGDAQVHPLPRGYFDVVLSRHGSMFFADPKAAFAHLVQVLRPGGRLALLVWQPLARNPWMCTIRAALAAGRDLPAPPSGAPGPFGLDDPVRTRTLLDGAGFVGVRIEDVEAPMVLGRDAGEAHAFVLTMFGGMLDGLDAPIRDAARARLLDALAAHAGTDGRVALGSASWLVTATRP